MKSSGSLPNKLHATESRHSGYRAWLDRPSHSIMDGLRRIPIAAERHTTNDRSVRQRDSSCGLVGQFIQDRSHAAFHRDSDTDGDNLKARGP